MILSVSNDDPNFSNKWHKALKFSQPEFQKLCELSMQQQLFKIENTLTVTQGTYKFSQPEFQKLCEACN